MSQQARKIYRLDKDASTAGEPWPHDLLGLCGHCLRGSAQEAAAAVTAELARATGCGRVSLGLRTRRGVRLQAVSGTPRIDPRSRPARALCAAMEECLAGGAPVAANGEAAPPAHTALLAEGEAATALCVPFSLPDGLAGAFLFERDRPLEGAERHRVETAAGLLGVLIAQRLEREERPVRRLARLLARHRRLARGIAAGLLLLVAGLTTLDAPYQVGADARLEGLIQRAVTAPGDGFLAETRVRPGDRVQAGQVLARLDDGELRVEQARLQGERDQLARAYRDALAGHDRARLGILQAQLVQADARLEQIAERLKRARLTAPITGIVVSGDLRQRQGAPVKRGEVLFEIAPPDAYRVVLRVDQRDIRALAEGQAGRLVLASLPGRALPLEVERITPIAGASDGRTWFRVEGRLTESSPELRPGMEGHARIEAGERPLWWLLGHRFLDWLRTRFWYWRP